MEGRVFSLSWFWWCVCCRAVSSVWPKTWTASEVSAGISGQEQQWTPRAELLLGSDSPLSPFILQQEKENYQQLLMHRYISFLQPSQNLCNKFSVLVCNIYNGFIFLHGWWVVHWKSFHERLLLCIWKWEKDRTILAKLKRHYYHPRAGDREHLNTAVISSTFFFIQGNFLSTFRWRRKRSTKGEILKCWWIFQWPQLFSFLTFKIGTLLKSYLTKLLRDLNEYRQISLLQRP